MPASAAATLLLVRGRHKAIREWQAARHPLTDIQRIRRTRCKWHLAQLRAPQLGKIPPGTPLH